MKLNDIEKYAKDKKQQMTFYEPVYTTKEAYQKKVHAMKTKQGTLIFFPR